MTTMTEGVPRAGGYSVQLEVDGPAPQGRLSILFRVILAIPHVIILEFLTLALGLVSLFAWFTILFTGRFPMGMLRFATGCSRWSARANAYVSLLTSVYPPFSLDEEADYPVRLIVDEQVENRSRLSAFFRIILVIPHAIVLYFLGIIAMFALFAAWITGIVLGRVPEGLHGFIAGVTRWSERVNVYGSLLVDEYPPFSFD